MARNQRAMVENRVVLFTDIHDYWPLTDVLGKNVCGFLQEMYEKLGDIIIEHKGEIVKYMGDAILSIFPADSEGEVVQCARKLRKAFANIVCGRGISHDTELEVGIGSGEVEIGVFGHRSLMQREVFGEEVNRVTVIGHHRGIAITDRVYHKVKMNYEVGEVPEIKAWRIIE